MIHNRQGTTSQELWSISFLLSRWWSAKSWLTSRCWWISSVEKLTGAVFDVAADIPDTEKRLVVAVGVLSLDPKVDFSMDPGIVEEPDDVLVAIIEVEPGEAEVPAVLGTTLVTLLLLAENVGIKFPMMLDFTVAESPSLLVELANVPEPIEDTDASMAELNVEFPALPPAALDGVVVRTTVIFCDEVEVSRPVEKLDLNPDRLLLEAGRVWVSVFDALVELALTEVDFELGITVLELARLGEPGDWCMPEVIISSGVNGALDCKVPVVVVTLFNSMECLETVDGTDDECCVEVDLKRAYSIQVHHCWKPGSRGRRQSSRARSCSRDDLFPEPR